ncbi:MAG: disulfide bond formation protein B [Acidimicrobiia bacterium]
MSLDQVSLFLAFLALAANLGALVVVVARLGARVAPGLATVDDRLRSSLGPAAPALAFLVAAVSTVGSLYLSEVAHLIPCRLCWFQRIAMYPLAVVFGIAWWRKDGNAWWYGLPIAGVGAVISTYHYLVQWRPALDSGSCSATVPCSAVYFRKLGFMSIPYMALSGFVAIVVLCLFLREPSNEPEMGDPTNGTDQVAKAPSHA